MNDISVSGLVNKGKHISFRSKNPAKTTPLRLKNNSYRSESNKIRLSHLNKSAETARKRVYPQEHLTRIDSLKKNMKAQCEKAERSYNDILSKLSRNNDGRTLKEFLRQDTEETVINTIVSRFPVMDDIFRNMMEKEGAPFSDLRCERTESISSKDLKKLIRRFATESAYTAETSTEDSQVKKALFNAKERQKQFTDVTKILQDAYFENGEIPALKQEHNTGIEAAIWTTYHEYIHKGSLEDNLSMLEDNLSMKDIVQARMIEDMPIMQEGRILSSESVDEIVQSPTYQAAMKELVYAEGAIFEDRKKDIITVEDRKHAQEMIQNKKAFTKDVIKTYILRKIANETQSRIDNETTVYSILSEKNAEDAAEYITQYIQAEESLKYLQNNASKLSTDDQVDSLLYAAEKRTKIVHKEERSGEIVKSEVITVEEQLDEEEGPIEYQLEHWLMKQAIENPSLINKLKEHVEESIKSSQSHSESINPGDKIETKKPDLLIDEKANQEPNLPATLGETEDSGSFTPGQKELIENTVYDILKASSKEKASILNWAGKVASVILLLDLVARYTLVRSPSDEQFKKLIEKIRENFDMVEDVVNQHEREISTHTKKIKGIEKSMRDNKEKALPKSEVINVKAAPATSKDTSSLGDVKSLPAAGSTTTTTTTSSSSSALPVPFRLNMVYRDQLLEKLSPSLYTQPSLTALSLGG